LAVMPPYLSPPFSASMRQAGWRTCPH
jgi:hypothetical protein